MDDGDGLPLAGLMAAQLAFDRAAAAAEQHHREQLIRFAAVTCGCPPWWAWRDGVPPQMECRLHSTVMVTPDGRVL